LIVLDEIDAAPDELRGQLRERGRPETERLEHRTD
jgi:hypothetical protein